ncbi:MFS transporter [Streptomyces sp. SCA3-4]|uniref:MFS transporter n=1 Tax=Streptomyces sichuanensis TaxID=2871810 RepID=UPI001CE35851|nr:MFS transporter [Streptomyces sichuanensis]MCA6091898.1 MFS transporter [Streptomyces sichuanensis]
MTSGPLRTCHLALLCGALAIAAPTAAVPAVSEELGMGPAPTQWFASGYQLGSGPLQLCAGHLADRHGARRTLLASLTVFTGGSLLAATTDHGTGMLAARLLQGAGGSALSPLSLSLLLALSATKDDERRAVGTWTATAAAASCLGPLLGGLLTSVLGWRAVFGALALVATVTAGCVLALLPGRAQHHVPLEGRFDGTGIALCTATATTVLIALTAPAAGAPPLVLPAAVGAAGTLLAVLLRRARRRADFALDGGLLQRPETRRALFVLPVLFCGNSLFTFLMYFELTQAHGLSPFRAALVTLPAVTPAVFTGRWAAGRTRNHGDGAPLMRTGLLCLAAGLLTGGLGRGGPAPLWLVGVSCALVGCGLGLANGAAMATVTRDRPGTASRTTATATTFAMFGGAAGPALAGALTTSFPRLPLLVTASVTAVASLALTRTPRHERPSTSP